MGWESDLGCSRSHRTEAAGLGGYPAAAGTVGAVTFAGVVTGLVPLAAAGALGILGRKFIIINVTVKSLSVIRSLLNVVYWPGLLHHTWRSVLYPGPGPGPWCSRLSSLLLGLACLSGQRTITWHLTYSHICFRWGPSFM